MCARLCENGNSPAQGPVLMRERQGKRRARTFFRRLRCLAGNEIRSVDRLRSRGPMYKEGGRTNGNAGASLAAGPWSVTRQGYP